MKHPQITGPCLVSMLVMGMALTGPAAAAPLWLLCLEGTGLTKYSNNQCMKAESGGKWQSVGIPPGKSMTVRIVGLTIRLADLEAGPLKEKATVKCNGPGSEGSGFIEPPNKGVITEAKLNEAGKDCERVEGFCEAGKVEAVEGVDLPWKQELFETEGKVQSKIESDGHGEPGWKVKCKTMLGSREDVCEESPGEPATATRGNRNSGELLVLVAALARKQQCSEGSKESGEMGGQAAELGRFGSLSVLAAS
jgi:hypothetical protein